MNIRSSLKKFFLLPPVGKNSAEQRTAQTLYILLMITTLAAFLSTLLQWKFAPPTNKTFNLISNTLDGLLGLGFIFWLRRGGIRPVSILTVIAAFLGTTYPVIAYADIRIGPAIFAYLVVLGLAVLLLKPRGILLTLIAIGGSLYLIEIAIERGILQPQIFMPDPFSAWISYLTILALGGGAMALAAYNLRKSIQESQEKNAALQAKEEELAVLNATLQHEIEERTAIIENKNKTLLQQQKRLERRNKSLELLAAITKLSYHETNIQRILQNSADLIHHMLGYYHIGLFLLDENRQFALLKAVNQSSQGGQRMIARQHRLPVGQIGVVGMAAATALPRIALDVGTDRVYFNNPDLPHTRSEMAIPMIAENRVLGVLDVQSQEANAFSDEDIEIFQNIAEIIAQTIRILQRLDESRRLAQEAARIYTERMQAGWQAMARRTMNGMALRQGQKMALEGIPDYPPEIHALLKQGQIYQSDEQGKTHLLIPIRLRKQTLGVIEVQSAKISAESKALLQAISRRVAMALENARLLDETHERAQREQRISEFGAQISTSINVDNILRTVVEEIANLVPGSEVTLQFLAQKEGSHD